MKLLKSEKLALLKIKEMTLDNPLPDGRPRITKVIKNEDFDQKGLKGRNLINKTTKSLKEKGLIKKWAEDDKYFRYRLQKSALYMFSK